jgi:hypothetical protein
MASYISSNANRFYTALESGYGAVASITGSNRIPALKLTVQQQPEVKSRKDKTGSRTFPGLPSGGRRNTTFELQTYMTSWQSAVGGPSYGPLFQAALGAAPQLFNGGVVASYSNTTLAFAAPHGLSVNQAVSSGGEIRFVAAVVDANTVHLNAPFTASPATGSTTGATVTYQPATELPSASVFDYWEPAGAVQRILSGAALDQMEIQINGDFHQFLFRGLAQDVLDSASFTAGQGDLMSYPVEPEVGAFDYSIVPGNLGQAWLGTAPAQFFTVTEAAVVLKNGLETRSREFGFSLPQAISPGQRSVQASIGLYSQADSATPALYQAAREQTPISLMFQLGQTQGQVMGVYLQTVIPEVPQFDDSANRLQWVFKPSRAHGTVDNELAVAFG